MTCQEVAFARATFRVEISEVPSSADPATFVAHLWLLDPEKQVRHTVVDAAGAHVEIRAASEALALSSAIGFLEAQFGALSESAHPCVDFGPPPRVGEPVVAPEHQPS